MFDFSSKKAVLFDLDDTLYSRVEAARKTFPGMFSTLLYPTASEALIQEAVDFMMTKVKRNSMIHPDAFAALLEQFPPELPFDREKCVDYYYDHMPSFACPFQETLPLLTLLRKKGIKVGLVTNVLAERVDSQKRKCDILGISSLFDALLYSGEVGIHKPDPRLFCQAADRLSVSPSECLFVGDSPEADVAGALAVGMEVLWIDHYGGENPFEQNPMVHRVSRLSDYFPL